ncbi:hypothetical protein EDI_255680 [Entamoeba dispar SAW760]|uniref:Uncharacterized protein n=1 Tax=Entamoeba dispar (strain ATCC PRA-260 / SAW760) TaxID=370354 RepID=B0EQ13_ENTDS|nr:uncharacterized protein EDI_255680 [Entamoeba dispar SAW760]EDR23382.1 hypothetical protein EDI_255680 [Entamoeba dispar SAW760]|eukprot:EDR23382.1 hypothetical protein EDI_255680 [Entamoeba dispar SAW760]
MNDIIKERIEKVIPGYYEQKQGMTQKETIFNKKLIKLKKESERIKIKLSNKTDTELDLEELLSDDYGDEYDIDTIITRKEFEEECYKRGIYEEFINKIKQVTQKKDVKKEMSDYCKGAAYLAYLKRGNYAHEVIYDNVPTPIGIEEGGKFEILIKEGKTFRQI